MAFFFETKDCIKLLFKYGADPNFLNIRHYSPLHYASSLIEKEPLVLLLNNGGDINLYDKSATWSRELAFDTPICSALKSLIYSELMPNYHSLIFCHRRFQSLISKTGLLGWSHLLNQIDVKSQHPFYYLLNKGVDLTVRCSTYGSILGEAIDRGRDDLALDIIESLYFIPDVVNVPSFEGESALMLVSPHSFVFDRLLEKGAGLSFRNNRGENILHTTFRRELDLVPLKKLLDVGIDINSVDNDGNSIINCDIDTDSNSDILYPDEFHPTIFQLIQFLVTCGLNLHHHNKKGQSNMAVILFSTSRINRKEYRLQYLKLVLENSNFKDIFANESNLTQKEIEIHTKDARSLYLAVHKSGDESLISKLNEKLPEEILNNFKSLSIE